MQEFHKTLDIDTKKGGAGKGTRASVSDHPFKSCEESILRLLGVKSKVLSALIGEKLVLRRAKGTGKLPVPEKNWVCGLPRGQ
jgi:hypothetical protein